MNEAERYLRDISENLERLEVFTKEGFEAFQQDEKTQYAVIRAYEIIGEAAKRLPQAMLDQQPTINWQRIKGFRDFLIHNYDKIDLNFIWVAVEDIPNLKAAVERLLRDLETTSPEAE
jgi:uncharacterized protein with HEPN domain